MLMALKQSVETDAFRINNMYSGRHNWSIKC